MADVSSTMDFLYGDALRRLQQYAERFDRALGHKLGNGLDGIVYATAFPSDPTAIKAFRFRPQYLRERDAFLRLFRHQVTEVCGFHVPQLANYDDELMVVEMQIVDPPFILDFGGATLDKPSADFPEDVLDEWEAEKREQFGHRWPRVDEAVSAFKRFGVFLSDVKPGNVVFGDEE